MQVPVAVPERHHNDEENLNLNGILGILQGYLFPFMIINPYPANVDKMVGSCRC
jgi:hypothetical protein